MVFLTFLYDNIQDPFGEKRGRFDYQAILKKLEALKTKYGTTEDEVSDLDDESDSGHEGENPQPSTTS